MTDAEREELITDRSPRDDDINDDNDDDDDTSYTTESDYEDDSSCSESSQAASMKEIIQSSWRQHLVAILIAVLATGIATYYQQKHNNREQHEQYESYMDYVNRRGDGNNNESPMMQEGDFLSSISSWKHEHLQGYRRTANISFCGKLQPRVVEQLPFMDFHVRREHLDAMKLHFVADSTEDDDYSISMEQMDQLERSVKDPEYLCFKQLEDPVRSKSNSDIQNMPKKTFVKGVTYYYQPPSFAAMFPDYEPEAATPGVTLLSPKNSAVKPAQLDFKGFAAKFINLSAQPILLHWESRNGVPKLVGEIGPMESLGTATTPGQSFFVTPVYDSSHALDRWVLTNDDPIMVYDDDSYDNPKRGKALTKKQRWLYQMHQLNMEFGKHYLIASKRTWLGHFPRPFPVHYMHKAAFVGQRIPVNLNDEQNNDKQQKKKKQQFLVVESVTPRVLTIDNFLSKQECEELIRMAMEQGLESSTLVTGASSEETTAKNKKAGARDLSTRSSTNTWLDRDHNMNTDIIYRRAAKLFNIDESLLWQNYNYKYEQNENDDPTQHSISESIQVVNYKVGEEYTAHHDFTYPSSIHRYQPTRFATLLMYLNDEGLQGGETNFPRATNPSKAEGLTVTPKQGRAVLFYNMLPDGNYDDLSQHASFPVRKGEKWLANLWIWDPVIN